MRARLKTEGQPGYPRAGFQMPAYTMVIGRHDSANAAMLRGSLPSGIDRVVTRDDPSEAMDFFSPDCHLVVVDGSVPSETMLNVIKNIRDGYDSNVPIAVSAQYLTQDIAARLSGYEGVFPTRSFDFQDLAHNLIEAQHGLKYKPR